MESVIYNQLGYEARSNLVSSNALKNTISKDVTQNIPSIANPPKMKVGGFSEMFQKAEFSKNIHNGTDASLGGNTPIGLKSILSPKNKFMQGGRRADNHGGQSVMTSSSNLIKTLDVGSPKNFRINSKASIIRESSNLSNKLQSWVGDMNIPSDKSSDKLKKSDLLEVDRHKNKKNRSDRYITTSDRRIVPKPVDSDVDESMNKTHNDLSEKKSSARIQRQGSSADSHLTYKLIRGIDSYVRVVFPSDTPQETAAIFDSLVDSSLTKFMNSLSKELRSYHSVAGILKESVANRKLAVEDKDIKEWVEWKLIFSSYLDKKRKIRLPKNLNYC